MLKVGVVGYLLQFSETKNNCSACNAKSKGGRGKAQHSFVDSHNSSVRESVGGCGLNHWLDVLKARKCCKFWPYLVASS